MAHLKNICPFLQVAKVAMEAPLAAVIVVVVQALLACPVHQVLFLLSI
jgi:nitrite reductase/ring-hydroxylating ferredoxin subunit